MKRVKARRIDYYPADFLAGIAGMKAHQIGVYWVACSLIYETGGPIAVDDSRLKALAGVPHQRLRFVIGELEALEKVSVVDGMIGNGRAHDEIARAENRIVKARQNGCLGGRPRTDLDPTYDRPSVDLDPTYDRPSVDLEATVSNKSNVIQKPGGLFSEKLSTINHQPSKKDSPPPLSRTDPEREAFDAYNAVAGPGRQAKAFSKTRRSKIRARLDECGGVDEWRVLMARAKASSFLRGDNDRGWRADLDFLLQQSSFTRLREGFYDDKQRAAPTEAPMSPADREGSQWRARVSAFVKRSLWLEGDWGPEPGRPDCKVPWQIMKEFGLEPRKLPA